MQLPRRDLLAGAFLAFGPSGDPISASGAGADSGLRADLAGDSGGALVSFLPSGTGAIARSVQDRLRDLSVTPLDFGAVGDKVTDDTAALALMATYVNSLCNNTTDPTLVGLRPRVVFPQGHAGFRTTASLVIDGWCDVIMLSPLWVTAAANVSIVGFRWKNNRSDSTGPREGEGVFDIRRITQHQWGDEADIGLLVDASYVSRITIKHTQHFCVGWDISNAYGRILLGDHRMHQKGGILQYHGDQFANQVQVLGGAFTVDGAGNGLARYGIELRGNPAYGLNTILLDGQSYELIKSQDGGNGCYPILCTGTGNSANITNQRSESNGGKFARIEGTWRNVTIGLLDAEVSYLYPTSLLMDDVSTGGGANVIYRQAGATGPLYKPFFDTGKLADKAVTWTGGSLSIQNMECATSVGAAPAQQTFALGDLPPSFDANGFYTQGSSMYGVRVRLNGEKTLGFTGLKKTASALDMKFLCFDAAGTQIYSANAVLSEGGGANISTGRYGGLYVLGVYPTNDATQFDVVVRFADVVKTVFVAIPNGVSGFQILGNAGTATWFSASSHLKDQFLADGLPVATANVTYNKGMKVAKYTADDLQPTSWTLLNSGDWRVDACQGFETTLPSYTVTNGATLRTFDANTVTVADLADVVATMIADGSRQGRFT